MKHIRFAFIALAFSCTAHAADTASGDFKDKLSGTAWSWPQTWGNVAMRWTEIRFNTDGSFTGWRGARALYNGTWQQTGPLELKLPGLGPSGVRVTFDGAMHQFMATDGRLRITGTATGSLGQTSQAISHGAQQSLNFSAPQPGSDPVVGRWRWKGNKITILSADGKAFMYSPGWAGMHGKWKLEDPKGLERKYVITWEGGLWIDSMRLTADHERLHGQNQKHHLIKAERMAKKE